MINKDLKLAVLGAGAMGCLFGGLLAEKGLNVILIDSLLRVVFKNSYFHIFGNIDFQFSLIAVGGYGRGELAPHSDLDILFLLPNEFTKNDTKKSETRN